MLETTRRLCGGLAALCAVAAAAPGNVGAQEAGRIEGRVTLVGSGEPIAGATVLLPRLARGAFTDADGRFEIPRVPAGRHEILAQRGNARASRVNVEVEAGEAAVVELELTVAHSLEEITVTTSPTGPRTSREAFNAVTTLDASDIAESMAGTIGEVLDGQPGVARRSFGPGSARPIVRGSTSFIKDLAPEIGRGVKVTYQVRFF